MPKPPRYRPRIMPLGERQDPLRDADATPRRPGNYSSFTPGFLDDKPQLVNPAYPPEPSPTGRVDIPEDAALEAVDLERYGVAATGWKPFWEWFVGIFRHDRVWWRKQIAFLVVLSLLVVAGGFVVANHWRRGVTLVGATAVLTAALRSFLPPDYVEMLEVRSRVFDVLFLLVMGSALLFLVVTVPA